MRSIAGLHAWGSGPQMRPASRLDLMDARTQGLYDFVPSHVTLASISLPDLAFPPLLKLRVHAVFPRRLHEHSGGNCDLVPCSKDGIEGLDSRRAEMNLAEETGLLELGEVSA